ncbi:MAG: hypothetical protein EOM25_00140 [Deltaproteobacteria bacterium]|nr:hypothetical protein [Deltaproteobacteria bacterium]
MKLDPRSITLAMSANPAWVPVLQTMAETGARAFGLDRNKGLRLAMGMEEILVFLSRILPGESIKITVGPDKSSVRAMFSLSAKSLDLSAMNVVAKLEGDEDDGHDLPLILASRISDSLDVNRIGQDIHLCLRQNHVYPTISPNLSKPGPVRAPLRVEDSPDPTLIAEGCARTLAAFPEGNLPPWFVRPGQAADLVASGDLHVAMAMDATDIPCALLSWHTLSERCVTFSGPWVFASGGNGVPLLLEHMLSILARSATVSLFNDPDATPPGLDFGKHGFEHLAFMPTPASMLGPSDPVPIWFRQLNEDNGLTVWSHPACVSFLEDIYGRLFLPRIIQAVVETGRHKGDRSLFAAELKPEMSEVIIRPLLDGFDNGENIQRHLQVLAKEGYERIFFSIDLAEGWQAALSGLLIEHGCQPLFVLPYGGRSDILTFVYVQPAT